MSSYTFKVYVMAPVAFRNTATLEVSTDALILHQPAGETITLSPSEVLALEIGKSWFRFFNNNVTIHHVAFEKVGTLIVSPREMSSKRFVMRVEEIGFVPRAERPRDWTDAWRGKH